MKASPPADLARRAVSATVANEVLAERERQHARWGVQDYPLVHADPGARWSLTSYGIWLPVRTLQARCAERFARGVGAWADILVEEVAEALDAAAHGDLAAARAELVQVAAVAVSAVESIDRTEGQ